MLLHHLHELIRVLKIKLGLRLGLGLGLGLDLAEPYCDIAFIFNALAGEHTTDWIGLCAFLRSVTDSDSIRSIHDTNITNTIQTSIFVWMV